MTKKGKARQRENEKSQRPSDEDDLALLAKINEAVAAVNEAEKIAAMAKDEFVSRSKQVGLLLLEAKKLHPAVKDFDAFLKRVNGLQLSRAYDCMRVAGGRTTDEEIRKGTRERVQKHREKKKTLPPPEKKLPSPLPTPKPEPLNPSVTSPPVTESPEVSVEQRRRENTNLGMTPAERWKQNLEWFAVACRQYLPNIAVETHRKEARRLVAELTQAKAA
jgi:hypothetical protein